MVEGPAEVMYHRDNQGIVPAAQDMEACQERQRAEGPGSLLKASHALPNGPFPKPPDPFMSLHKSTIGWPVGILSLIESFFVCLFLLVPNLSNPFASLPPKLSLHLAPTASLPPPGATPHRSMAGRTTLPRCVCAGWSELLVSRLPSQSAAEMVHTSHSSRLPSFLVQEPKSSPERSGPQ